MLKKTLGLVITAVMLLGVFACNNDTLDAYKTAGKVTIEAYAQERKDNYCEDNWTIVCGIVETGNQAVDDATNRTGVDTAVTVAKAEIDKVEMEEVDGMFSSLDDAFDNGWLTVEQLQSIAYYYYEECIAHDHAECETVAPIPKNPLTLSNGTQTAIKQTYLVELQIRVENATLDNIQIANYLGTYSDCIIVGVTDNCFLYDYLFEPERTIGGVLFRSYCANFTQVWKVK